jgi:hypothetical protein
VAVSSVEDVATVGLLWLAYEHPYLAAAIAIALLALTVALLLAVRRLIRRVFPPKPVE